MTIEELLKDRKQLLTWDEPYPGISAEGKDRICNVTKIMSAEDAIDYMRAVVAQRVPDKDMSDNDLLQDFIAIHWATWL